jgi:YVTN family beta-propeller protein
MRGEGKFCIGLPKGVTYFSTLVLGSLWLALSCSMLAEAQPFTYIPNFDDGTVSVINTATDTVISTVPVAVGPTSVVAHPDGNRVYVTHGQSGGNKISMIDTFTNTIAATFASGGINPEGAAIHPDGTRLYVTNSGDGVLTVIDTTTNQIIATVRGMNDPLGVAVHPDGTWVYVGSSSIGQPVSVIDAAQNTVIESVDTGSPTQLAVHPDGTRVYVTNLNYGNVSVIDTVTHTVKTTIRVGLEPYGVASHPDGTRVYVGNRGDYTMSVIDTTTDTVIATVSLAAGPCHVAVHPDGTRVYVAHEIPMGNSISVIDTIANTVTGTIMVGSGPQGIAFSIQNEIIKLLGSAGPEFWAVLGLGGSSTASSTQLSMSGSSSVVGTVPDVGVARAGKVNMSGSSVIGGRLFFNTAGTLNKSGTTSIARGIRKDVATDVLLSQAVADALVASKNAAALTPTITSITNVTITNPSQNKTIMGGLKTNTLTLTNLIISNGILTLSAPRGGQFVINISGNFSLSGGSKVILGGELTPYDVLFNVTGAGGQVALTGGSTVSGIILAPQRGIALSPGLVTGEVVSGGNQIAMTSTGQVNNLEQFDAIISAVPVLGSAPLQVQFNSVVQGGIAPYTYLWDLDGNGTVDDTRRAFSYTYQQPGIYPVTLRVNDAKGNSVLATIVTNVTIANRNPITNPGGPYTGVVAVPIQFNGSGSSDPDGDPLTYSWNFGDGRMGSGVNPTHVYSSPGTYTVTLRVEDGRGGSGTAQTTAQINNPIPSLSSISPSSVIAGNPDFTMILNGENFLTISIVSFNNIQYSPRYINKTQMEVTIPSSAIMTAGSCPVKVINPTPGGGETSSLTFTVKPRLEITITSPLNGETVNKARTMVRGTVRSDTKDFGITVNGILAENIGSNWVANNVSLAIGSNTITAVATDSYGNTDTKTITIIADELIQPVQLSANVTSGIPPLQVSFTVSTSITPSSYQIDFDGDGIVDYTGTAFDGVSFTYTTEGVFYPKVTISDGQWNTYSDTIAIAVLSDTEMDTLLKSKWDAMKGFLASNDIDRALSSFTEESKRLYGDIFNALQTQLPQIVQEMQDIQLVYMKNGFAKYRMRKNEPYGSQILSITYYVYFAVDANGVWRIYRF